MRRDRADGCGRGRIPCGAARSKSSAEENVGRKPRRHGVGVSIVTDRLPG